MKQNLALPGEEALTNEGLRPSLYVWDVILELSGCEAHSHFLT